MGQRSRPVLLGASKVAGVDDIAAEMTDERRHDRASLSLWDEGWVCALSLKKPVSKLCRRYVAFSGDQPVDVLLRSIDDRATPTHAGA
ncbi:MAG TPA: hypothetical protein VF495_19285 [Phenylobacterium sp.]